MVVSGDGQLKNKTQAHKNATENIQTPTWPEGTETVDFITEIKKGKGTFSLLRLHTSFALGGPLT